MALIFILLLLTQPVPAVAFGGEQQAWLEVRVVDAESGKVIPCTVSIQTGAGSALEDHPGFRGGFRSAGEFTRAVPAGATALKIERGFDFVAAERRIDLKPGERVSLRIALQRRSPLHREGWYAGDNHVHMVHGERKIPVDFAYAALAARAEGLDYMALAQAWNIASATPEELERACRAMSTPDFVLTWNLEAPKSYWRGDVSKCLGHGWTLAMRGRTASGADAIRELLQLSAHDYESMKEPAPNFESHALIHELGGIVSYSHPCRWWWGAWGGKGIYPEDPHKFVSNMAAELPFDTVAGPTYDTIDVLMQTDERTANECALKLWFMLLDHGYRIAASGSSDATFDNPGGAVPGRIRLYARVPGEFSLAGCAQSVRTGRSFVTSGPLLVLEMDGRGSGDVLQIEGSTKTACRIRAWASGVAGEHLTRVELIRNGETVRNFEIGAKTTRFEKEFEIEESGSAWYIARCHGSNAGQMAITNPVYFEPPGYQPPAGVSAHVKLAISDRSTGRLLDGICETVKMVGPEPVKLTETRFLGGRLLLSAPATSRLRIRVPGYVPMTRSIFVDYAPVPESVFAIRAERLTDWNTFEQVRLLLQDVRLDFPLEKDQR